MFMLQPLPIGFPGGRLGVPVWTRSSVDELGLSYTEVVRDSLLLSFPQGSGEGLEDLPLLVPEVQNSFKKGLREGCLGGPSGLRS